MSCFSNRTMAHGLLPTWPHSCNPDCLSFALQAPLTCLVWRAFRCHAWWCLLHAGLQGPGGRVCSPRPACKCQASLQMPPTECGWLRTPPRVLGFCLPRQSQHARLVAPSGVLLGHARHTHRISKQRISGYQGAQDLLCQARIPISPRSSPWLLMQGSTRVPGLRVWGIPSWAGSGPSSHLTTQTGEQLGGEPTPPRAGQSALGLPNPPEWSQRGRRRELGTRPTSPFPLLKALPGTEAAPVTAQKPREAGLGGHVDSRSPLCLLPRLQPKPPYSSACQTGHSMPALGHLPLHALLLPLPGPGERDPAPGPASPCWPEMPDFHTDQPPPGLFLSSQTQPTSVPEAVLWHVAGHGPLLALPPSSCLSDWHQA